VQSFALQPLKTVNTEKGLKISPTKSREGTHGPTGVQALTGIIAEDMHFTAICYQLPEAGQDS